MSGNIKKILIGLPVGLVEEVDRIAVEEKRSRVKMIEMMVEDGVGRRGEGTEKARGGTASPGISPDPRRGGCIRHRRKVKGCEYCELNG